MKKFRSLFAVLLAIGLMMAIVACDGGYDHAYTVTVKNVDGSAWSGQISACEVEANGELGMCYGATAQTDANGVAFLDEGSDMMTQVPTESQHVEIHLIGVLPYLTFNETRIHKGESANIELRYRTESELDAKTGNGTEDLPYAIKSGTEYDGAKQENHQFIYGFKFDGADQKIVFAVTVKANDSYTVKTQSVDAKIVKLNSTEEGFEATETTGNGTLNITTGAEETVVYLEVSLNGDATDALAYIWVA
ncbi:MAG: hypothetical protein J1F36_00930 [Clostridiales bacterium]|nr:hypothetical protein [Clostridiales bacterium]